MAVLDGRCKHRLFPVFNFSDAPDSMQPPMRHAMLYIPKQNNPTNKTTNFIQLHLDTKEPLNCYRVWKAEL